MGRLVSGEWVSASFQMFTLTAGEMSWVGGKLSGRGMFGEKCIRGDMSYTCETQIQVRELSREYKYDTTQVRVS